MKRLKARCEWHYSGGPSYCSGCIAQKLPCSEGKSDPLTGEFCPYLKNEPFTCEGHEAWELLKLGSVLKYYPSGAIAGFDIPTIVSMTHALGYDSQAVLRLLEHAEQGLREAVKKHGDSNTEHIDSHSGS